MHGTLTILQTSQEQLQCLAPSLYAAILMMACWLCLCVSAHECACHAPCMPAASTCCKRWHNSHLGNFWHNLALPCPTYR